MKSTVCSGVHAPAGFSVRPRAVSSVKTKPGIRRCALEPAVRRVAQLVLERLGEDLHAGLGDVVGRVARRGGDALLRAGVDDEARAGRARSCRARTPGMPWITPHRLTASTRSQFSAGPKMPLPGWMPALFMRTSVPPKRSRTAASSRRRSSARLTSVSTVMTSPAPPGAAAATRLGGAGEAVLAEVGDAHAQTEPGEALRRRQGRCRPRRR